MAKLVLVCGLDGLQPSQVTPELMPHLAGLAAEGVTFEDHHSVFPTVTRVNVASMMTGRYPGGHGLAGNHLVIRDYDPDRAINALRSEFIQVMEKTGRLLLAPHLAELLAPSGQVCVSVGSGSTGNSMLHNPFPDVWGGAIINPEFCDPAPLRSQLVRRFGNWPEKSVTQTPRVAHAVRLMTEYVLPELDPALAILWSSDPDSTQHSSGVGSDAGRQALKGADAQLGALVRWLEQSGREADTDMLVVSDHGYSTITEVVPVEDMVRDAGFPKGGRPGGVVVADNGGSVLFYVHRRDPQTADRLATWLMGQPWCGALLAPEAVGHIEGVIAASEAGVDGPRAPDLAMSFAWTSQANDAGFPGHMYSTGGAPGLGMHGSMSRHEQKCVLIARGPSFKVGARVQAPSGNVDLTPTILRLLGVAGGQPMDGRVLEEALKDGSVVGPPSWSTEVYSARRQVAGGVYGQEITVSRLGTTLYVDEGSARLQPS